MSINKGDIFWIPVFDENGINRDIIHPHVVISDSVINNSRIDSVIVCGLTTNMKKAYEHGNILLDAGEGNLPKRSIIAVSQISIVNKKVIGDFIGSLSEHRLNKLFHGMELIQSL